jgi:hypothetical protein
MASFSTTTNYKGEKLPLFIRNKDDTIIKAGELSNIKYYVAINIFQENEINTIRAELRNFKGVFIKSFSLEMDNNENNNQNNDYMKNFINRVESATENRYNKQKNYIMAVWEHEQINSLRNLFNKFEIEDEHKIKFKYYISVSELFGIFAKGDILNTNQKTEKPRENLLAKKLKEIIEFCINKNVPFTNVYAYLSNSMAV